ncbi:uncharacterized protein K444DRAFT_146014 [Hyaloscypha bicolor E]|uniref:Uncharacterized protein n=1 Tax=Hyaloscypha bicolor E TaxID=1095630 RepID=A0A2J6SSM5_9HELO|nr:uncharacterized protein K444DRAFT_146014 [Hyaloscypha bicolor E]PMD53750.1 hypothetical protein K444DRAFT_146014 [Hyaloscypha bicolor E]
MLHISICPTMKTPPNTTTRSQKLNLAPEPLFDGPLSFPRNKMAKLSSKELTKSAHASEDITQPLDKQVEGKQIHDSDDSSLSSIMSTQFTSEKERLSHQPQQANQDNTESQLLPNDPSDEELFRTFCQKWNDRHIFLPKVFDKQGRLLVACTHLQPKIDAAKKQRKRQAAANKQLARSLLEAPIGVPASFNVQAASQANIEPMIQMSTEEPRMLSQPGVHPAETLALHGSPFQASKGLPPIGTLSTPSTKKISDLKAYGRGRKQTSETHPKKAQDGAGYNRTGRSLRSGLPSRPSEYQEAFQSLPTSNLTADRRNGQQLLPPVSKELSFLPGTSSSTSPEENNGAQIQISTPPQPSQTECLLPSPSVREQAAAARGVQDKIQQQRSQSSQLCSTCRKNSCSCTPTQQPPEEILCSDNDCFRRRWGAGDLLRFCGIRLCDAQETKGRFNCWFCPECANKARVLLEVGPTSSSSFSSSHNATIIVPGGPGNSVSDHGAWPEDAEIREPLQALTGIMQQYTGTTTMARNQLSLINPQTPILDIPCIRDETLHSNGTANNAINILRQLLDVSEGVLIKQKVTEANLQDTTSSVWIRSILSFLVTKFVFYSGSPFEDATLWNKILTTCKHFNVLNHVGATMIPCLANACEVGHTSEHAENIIHEYRIRLMKAFEASPEDPDIPPEFRDRLSERRRAFVALLNVTMLPLVGGNTDVQARHRKMASVASELNLKVFAYKGTFEEIRPQMNEQFDPQRHAEDTLEPGFLDLAGQAILMTTMMGVRFRHPEKGWRTCSPAKVKVWSVNDALRDPYARVRLPDMACGNSPKQKTRIIPQKRRVGEVS